MEEFWRKHEEYMERSARQHNEIMTLLREIVVSRGCYVSDWSSSAGVEGVEGTQSDNGCETKVVVKTSVVSEQGSIQQSENLIFDMVKTSVKELKEEDKWQDANRLGERTADTSESFGLPELKEADSKEHKKVVPRRSEEPDHTKLENFNEQLEKMADEPFMRVQSDYVAAWVGLVSHQQTTTTYELKFDTRSDTIFGVHCNLLWFLFCCIPLIHKRQYYTSKYGIPELLRASFQSNTLRTRCFWGPE